MAADRPPYLHHETARPEWTDYNGHMNLAYYLLVFDHATDALLDQIGLDAVHRERTGGSVFVVEAHLTYGDEVRAGEDLHVATRVLGVDGKRLHLFHEMFAGPDDTPDGHRPVATNELMILHVDLATRRSAGLPEKVRTNLESLREQHAALPAPKQAGRAVSMAKNQ